MKRAPIEKYVLVRKINPEVKTASGISLVGNLDNDTAPLQGEVLAVANFASHQGVEVGQIIEYQQGGEAAVVIPDPTKRNEKLAYVSLQYILGVITQES